MAFDPKYDAGTVGYNGERFFIEIANRREPTYVSDDGKSVKFFATEGDAVRWATRHGLYVLEGWSLEDFPRRLYPDAPKDHDWAAYDENKAVTAELNPTTAEERRARRELRAKLRTVRATEKGVREAIGERCSAERGALLKQAKRLEASRKRVIAKEKQTALECASEEYGSKVREREQTAALKTDIQRSLQAEYAKAIRSGKRGKRRSPAEAREEAEHAVVADLPESLVPVWERVKGRIKGGPKKSRTEAFLEWVEEHPDEALEIQASQADNDVERWIKEYAEQYAEANPLERGASRGVIGRNIRREMKAGRPHAQAVAIALSEARRTARKGEKKPVEKNPADRPHDLESFKREAYELTLWAAGKRTLKHPSRYGLKASDVRAKDFDRMFWLGEAFDDLKHRARLSLSRGDNALFEQYVDAIGARAVRGPFDATALDKLKPWRFGHDVEKNPTRISPTPTGGKLRERGYVWQFDCIDRDMKPFEIKLGQWQWILCGDPTGRAWPKNEALITKYQLTDAEEEKRVPADLRKYAGDVPIYRGELLVPSGAEWELVGVVSRIWYERTGKLEKPYQHPYGEHGEDLPNLYTCVVERKRFYRLDLGKGSVWNERGFVKP